MYHIIFRPNLENLPKEGQMHEFIAKKATKWIISKEKGKSTGKEHFNHYDMVVDWKGSPRCDSIKRALCAHFKIPSECRRNIKVYVIDDDRMDYQIGYSRKENLGSIIGGFSLEDLERGESEYKITGTMKQEEFGNDWWTTDQIAMKFKQWLKDNDLTGMYNATQYLNTWLRENEEHIKFSTYSKIKKESLYEWAGGWRD